MHTKAIHQRCACCCCYCRATTSSPMLLPSRTLPLLSTPYVPVVLVPRTHNRQEAVDREHKASKWQFNQRNCELES